jgi:hypothetical protein
VSQGGMRWGRGRDETKCEAKAAAHLYRQLHLLDVGHAFLRWGLLVAAAWNLCLLAFVAFGLPLALVS